MYRYIYKITCTSGSFKNKYYYGQHTTDNLEDNYNGSGKLLKRYYKKYPNDYIKEIICFCKSQEELDEIEYNIIHPCLNDSMCLNLVEGGTGMQKGSHLSEETRRKISESNKGKLPHNKGLHLSEDIKKKISFAAKNRSEETIKKLSNSHKGKHLSEETKLKIGKIHKGKIISKEVRIKISNTLKGNIPNNKGMKMNDDFKKKCSKVKKNCKWMTDKYSEYFVNPEYWAEFIDNGFSFGRKQKYLFL